ncbi:MAG: VanZ family protein [Halobacteria archaeon]|nr:VanZ family protein [Halobacteria archaeon]
MTQRHLPVVDDLHGPLSHIMAFYLLTLLIDFAFPVKPTLLAKLALLLGYGFGIEVFQTQFTERTCSMIDLLADMIGVMLYLASIPILKNLPWLRYRWSR